MRGLTGYNKESLTVNIFLNDTMQKCVGDPFKLQGDLKFAFDQQESEIQLSQGDFFI